MQTSPLDDAVIYLRNMHAVCFLLGFINLTMPFITSSKEINLHNFKKLLYFICVPYNLYAILYAHEQIHANKSE